MNTKIIPEPERKATPDNAVHPSEEAAKNEPTPERAREEKRRMKEDAAIEPQNRQP